MKYKDFQKKSLVDLKKDLKTKSDSLRGFRFGVSGGKVTNVKEGNNLKKDIARINTALREKNNQDNV